jgi:hypothetical protein
VFDELVALQSDDKRTSNLWNARMFLHVLKKEWEAAQAAAQRYTTHHPQRAALALLCDDLQEFERIRDSRPANWPPNFTTRLLSLAPTTELLTSELLAAARGVAEDGTIAPWVLGIAEFRGGNLHEAVRHLESCEASGPRLCVWSVLAMAYYDLGNEEQARQSLAKADKFLAHREVRHASYLRAKIWSGEPIYHWLEALVYHREAKQMIEGTPDQPKASPQLAQGQTPEPGPVAKPEPKDGETATLKPPAPEAPSNPKPKEKQKKDE